MAYSKSDFQSLAIILRRTSNEYLDPPINAITYNPEKEILTLTADTKPKVEKAMADLSLLVKNFSEGRGNKYLATSHPSTSRPLLLDNSSAHGSTKSRMSRTFPIIPKEHLRLVQIWFKSILPALPEILSERLGEIFTVSLIRRGQTDLRAEPCIQIGCPCVPGQAAQKVIKDLVDKLWEKDGIERIPMRFIEGSIKKLSGVEGAGDDDGRESADLQKLDFNYNRPYSKAGMGASVGVLCTGKLSGTLGGYVLIDGEKFLLTSEHIITKARTLADGDGDPDTLTSPSMQDLQKMENDLKQNVRDIGSEIKSLMQKHYGDRDFPESDFSDSNLPPELHDARSKAEVFKSLLDQVTRAPVDYAVGKVKKLSLGTPRRHVLSRSLTQDLGWQDSELETIHHMDWALITTENHAAQTGENQHKYRSKQDAIDELLYVDENDRASRSGDVVYETCSPAVGHTVYYVGQRSKHKYGQVSMPTFDNSTKTQIWAIMGLDGHDIPCSDVKGDSGAWVIREADNKLMGQVHSHDLGQVLFTPIDVIFAELEEICQTKVSLPPSHPGSDKILSTDSAIPLCSEPQTPFPRPYKFNFPARVEPITAPRISPIKITVPEPDPLESSSVMTTTKNTNTTPNQLHSDSQYDSPLSLSTLIDSPLSSVTTPEYPKSPQSSGNFERLPSMSLPTTIGESTMSDIPDLSLDKAEEDQPSEHKPYTIQFKFQSLPRIILSTRTSTWTVALGKSEATKAWLGSQLTQLRASRKHAVPHSARAVLDKFARSARRIRTSTRRHDEYWRYQRLTTLAIEDVTDIETIPSPSAHESGSLASLVEDVRKRDYSFMPKDCNVAV